jgi:RHS repeat-associated protein
MGESSVKTSQKDNKMKENKKIKIWSTLLFLSISIFAFSQTTIPPSFHDTKGNVDVNAGGQLQFTLPIAEPPGVKNVAPHLSLSYTSGASNGIAGYGWSIAGTSSISRVGKNIEKDNEIKGIQFDYSDYYSLNGQRLILKSGEYGKDGAEYVTEKFSNAKIKSFGSISGQNWTGPEYWEVISPDGSQAWYGATTNGNNNARTPLEYNIVKWKDAQGNYISYNYIQGAGTNVSLISSIEWGGNENAGKPHFNQVQFNYNVNNTRELVEQSYVNGIALIQDKLLNNVVVRTNGLQYRKYDITYKTDDTKYQFIEKIQEYNSDNETANPIAFERYNQNVTHSYIDTSVADNFYPPLLSGNFRGMHFTDFVYAEFGGYYLRSFKTSSLYFLGNENIFTDAVPMTIKDANDIVSNREGFVRYSVDPTTKDITLKYYLINLNVANPSTTNALSLIGTKIIAGSLWTETEHTSTSNPLSFYDKTSSIKKIMPYDIDGDGVPEVLIEKKIHITNTTCPSDGGVQPLDPTGRPINCQPYSYDLTKYIVVKQQDNSFPYFEFYLASSEEITTGDFNGDGVDDIAQSSPYWGETVNGEFVPANLLQAYNVKKDDQGNYNLVEVFTANYLGLSSTVQTGDFNGDGITDLFTRTNVNNHYFINLNTGKEFQKLPYFNDFSSTEGYTSSQNGNYSTAKVLDINKDGKSDIINFYTNYNIASSSSASSSYTVKVSENQGFLDGKIKFGSNPPVTKNVDGPYIYREILGVRQNELHIYGPGIYQTPGRVFPYTHYANLQELVPNTIRQGGKTINILYDDGYTGPVSCTRCYRPVKSEEYPFMELGNLNSKIVSVLAESANQVIRFKQFLYRGLTINLNNKSSVGFRQSASSSWYSTGFENTKIWSGIETDPLNEGMPVKEWTIRTNDETKVFPADISENNTQLLTFKSTGYQNDKLLNGVVVNSVPDAQRANVVKAILPKTTRVKNFLTGDIAESTITYGNYYLPSQSISKINTTYSVTTANYLYDNNPSGIGADYYIGRPTSNSVMIQAYGDSKSNKDDFTYENNLIKSLKSWSRDNTAYVLDTFTYNDFGNLIQKTSTNSLDAQTITSANEYDSKGRFIVKQTDNLGLQTQISYNDSGSVLTSIDPLNNTVTNTYDGWGKMLTTSSNLTGTTTYEYNRDNDLNVAIIQNSPDGNISKKYSNTWGQEYKTTTKALGQGQYVSKNTKYDAIGRKLAESEPYFEGQSPSKWNAITYDDTVFPSKVTATFLATLNATNEIASFIGKKVITTVSGPTTTTNEVNNYNKTTSKTVDALGNTISTTDNGGTVQFLYNAAGQQIKASYAGNSVTTKYDEWGRKSELNDPSNGKYTYEYDSFGRAKKTVSPKGEKVYNYNNFGQLISQNEYSTIDNGETTNKTISFAYNDKGLITLKSGVVKGQNFSNVFTFDSYGRLTSMVENSNGKIFSQKGLIYNSNGKISSYEKELQSSGITTKITIENVYSSWSGDLYQIKDKITGKILSQINEVNAQGQVLQSKLGAVNIDNSYDANGFLTSIDHSSTIKPHLLQIAYSFNGVKNELLSRTTSGDFNITELFDYDDNNRLINWTNPLTNVKPASIRNLYDVKGRILENDQVGIMQFENSAKMYQPTGMTLNTQGTQNYNGDLIQSITYNENNDPVQITGEKSRVKFDYGLGSMRQRVDIVRLKNPAGGGGEPPITEFSVSQTSDFDEPIWQNIYAIYYNEDNSFEVVRNRTTGQEKHIIYIEGSPYESNIVYLKDFGQTDGSYKFLHKDYIGSILAISDETGNKLEQRHFDAWGNFTHLQIGNNPITTDKSAIAAATLLIDRGYTSHEHYMDVGIIHMNGRLYDPLLRRFLNADENIQDPTNTQNYNKYGYVMNNPMMYTDPSGEIWGFIIGAIVGSYISGVQANHGNANPFKWDWKNSWSAVVGGAFAGGAIGGGIQNVSTNFVKNSVVGAIGSAFNGLATGQNIFKSALVGFTGVNYSFDISGNKMTSTDGITAAYKYIISPEYNEEGETEQYFQMAGFSQYGASGGLKPPFDGAEIGQLASAGIISAVTARVLIGAVGAEIAGAGVIGAGGGITWSSAASAGTQILARTFALGLLLSVRGDSSGPEKAYVYTIMGSKDRIAKFGITRAMDPNSRPSGQISGINRFYDKDAPHSWMYLHQGVTVPEAFLYEKYYVWQYFENRGEMPYAQRYPKADAVTRYLYEYLKIK